MENQWICGESFVKIYFFVGNVDGACGARELLHKSRWNSKQCGFKHDKVVYVVFAGNKMGVSITNFVVMSCKYKGVVGRGFAGQCCDTGKRTLVTDVCGYCGCQSTGTMVTFSPQGSYAII